ncbi:MAG TPA: ADP-ribosyl-[dinitrogen reductase] hydrolase [Desulfobacter sp.]|uniref:ADP-ribosyl-[dinitrogen reductase] hydrolase n=1 Tax=unclassified Desulfobacter TaxID=2634406 RepID=UPI000E84BB19|nr:MULTISPECIES: ADP-ribosyl-[dinitrogen reductase] hydrolase [unclassified Desulfobacter]MBP8829847.1 ADP-ribosyl-[dinitrogen reductase] hydrolase [Desulfobacter sp.]MBP9598365.1 ADP-ribosyl-[dinitrogen reductase] hydrolase [Desulfobacter sp.]HAR33716.1 ADP-ribosyl-[dinitrogen reductase] hydrolase [Desulfobacter sp.]HRF90061.1 ADP-ribosyl-[dinitrogen reductase] hydrolase [Desulfobacter postgatei]
MKSVRIPDRKQIVGRAKGAFVGLAIGDALGATTEFMTPQEIKLQYGVHKQIIGKGWLYLKAGQVTDDTQMSICIGRAIRDSQGWNLTAVADEFANWVKGRPIDVGSTCARGIRNYILYQTLEAPPSRWSAGNGALMRMLPVALYTLGNEESLDQYVVEQAHLTHNNPLSDTACIFFGRLLHEAMMGGQLGPLLMQTKGFVNEHPDFCYDPYPGKSSAFVVDTVQTVFHFLFSTDNFEDCLIGTVNQGGDADTTGALAGMLAGALYGVEGIPKRWLKRLDSRVYSEVDALAEYLVDHSPALLSLKN